MFRMKLLFSVWFFVFLSDSVKKKYEATWNLVIRSILGFLPNVPTKILFKFSNSSSLADYMTAWLCFKSIDYKRKGWSTVFDQISIRTWNGTKNLRKSRGIINIFDCIPRVGKSVLKWKELIDSKLSGFIIPPNPMALKSAVKRFYFGEQDSFIPKFEDIEEVNNKYAKKFVI